MAASGPYRGGGEGSSRDAHATFPRHCEPFDAARGVAQDKLLLRSSEAIQTSLAPVPKLDCFVAALLAMTAMVGCH